MAPTPNDNYGTTGSTGGSSALGTGTDSMGVTGTGAGQSASTGAMGGTTGGNVSDIDLGAPAAGGSQGLADRLSSARDTATDKLSSAKDMAAERLGQVREKASNLSATLADKLEQGANTLRQQGTGGQQLAGVDGTTAEVNPQVQKLQGTAADAMQKTAEFLRNGDIRASLEEQVRTNPGRTLLVALGLGYIVGKAVRRR